MAEIERRSPNGKTPPPGGNGPTRGSTGARDGSGPARPADPRRALGSRAEHICEMQLRRRGWRILDRNWRVRMGEIDIVAMDGSTLVIVEVKAHSSSNRAGPSVPALAVGPRKQGRLRRLATAWLMARGHRHGFENLRFDVVGITFSADGTIAGYEHIEDAF
jgi:putative endonuclease